MTNDIMTSQDLEKRMQNGNMYRRARQLEFFSLVAKICAVAVYLNLYACWDKPARKPLAAAGLAVTMAGFAADVRHDRIFKKIYDVPQTR